MKFKQVFVLFVLCFVYSVGGFAYAQAPGKKTSFDPSMSLAETMKWLARRMPYIYFLPAVDSAPRRREQIRSVKAKDCTLSYEVTSDLLDKNLTALTPRLLFKPSGALTALSIWGISG